MELHIIIQKIEAFVASRRRVDEKRWQFNQAAREIIRKPTITVRRSSSLRTRTSGTFVGENASVKEP